MVTRMWNFTQKKEKRNPTNPRKANWNCNKVKSLGDAPHDHCLATGRNMQSWTSRSQKRTLISKLKPSIKPFCNIIESAKPGSLRLARCFQTNAISRLMMATQSDWICKPQRWRKETNHQKLIRHKPIALNSALKTLHVCSQRALDTRVKEAAEAHNMAWTHRSKWCTIACLLTKLFSRVLDSSSDYLL